MADIYIPTDFAPSAPDKELYVPSQLDDQDSTISEQAPVVPGNPGSVPEALIVGAGRALRDVGRGAAQLVTGAGEKLGVVKAGTLAELNNRLAQNREVERRVFEPLTQAHPIASTIGNVVGGALPFIAVPATKGVGLLGKMATQGAIGAGIGASQYTPPDGDKVRQAVVGGAIGAAIPVVTQGIQAGLRTVFSPLDKAATIAERAAPGELKIAAQASMESPIRTSFVDLSKDKGFINAASKLNLSRNKVKQIDTFLRAQQSDIKTTMASMVKNILPEGDEAAAKAQLDLYTAVKPLPVKSELLAPMLKYPDIASRYKKVLTENPDIKMNTIEHLDAIKKSLDDGISSAINKEGASNTAYRLQGLKNKLVEVGDNAAPPYALARKVAQRIQIKDKFIQAANNIPDEDPQKIFKIYNEMWGTPAKREFFLKDIKQIGGDVDQTKKVIAAIGRVKNSPLLTLSGKPTEVGTRFNVAQGPQGLISVAATKLATTMKHGKVIDIMLDPKKWGRVIDRVDLSADPNKIVDQLTKMLTIVGATQQPKS